jgi:hypothetical protein
MLRVVYAECRKNESIMLSVIMLNVVMLIVVSPTWGLQGGPRGRPWGGSTLAPGVKGKKLVTTNTN